MTIELTDLDTIPADQVAAAFTLVAVAGPAGPVRYKAPLGTGGSGQGLTFRGPWAAATAYAAYDVLTNAGSSYLVTAAFTSGQNFSLTNLALIAAKGDPGAAGTGASAAIATALAAGLVKPDGTTLTVTNDGTLSVPRLSPSSLPAKTDSLGADLLTINRAGADYSQTVAAFLAANQTTIHALTASAAPDAADELALYHVSAGVTGKVTLAQLAAAVAAINGTPGGSTATAPGQVGSLTAGTPASTAIPVTYTAPAGAAPITYAGQTSPHGTSTWTNNAGTFTSTAGTFTGLTASTSYDLRIIATNAAGSSTTTLTAVVTAASAGSSAAAIQSTANIPTSGTALDPLGTGAMIVFQNILIAYICLYHNAADEGTRLAFGGGGLPPLPPQDYANGGSYTIRLYDAPTGGNLFYESPAIMVATNPGQVGGSISAIYWPDGQIVTPAAHGTSAMNQDGYWGLSGAVTEADLYLSSSSTQAPDVAAGAATIIGQSLNVSLQNVVTLYGSVRNMSQRPTYTGTAYLWMCVTDTSGTRSRICHTSNPITIT